MSDGPKLPAGAGAALYPDGGNNPSGYPAAAIDPATGQPKFSAAPAAPDPAKPADPAPAAVAEPAKPEGDPPKPGEAEAKPAEGEAKPEGEAPAPVSVEAYKDLTLPEAFAVDAPTLDAFKETAAELGLPPDGAKRLLDMYADVATKQIEQLRAAAAAEHVKQQTAWVDEIRAMPEFQGEAAERSQTFLGRLMDEFGTPELRDYMETGIGNNPHLVRMILTMGQALVEGEPTPIGEPGKLAGPKPNGASRPKSAGDVLYGGNTAN